MKSLRGFAIIMACSFLGQLLIDLLGLPLPGSILGMLLLLLLLVLGWVKLETVAPPADLLVSLMMVMLIPGGVALMVAAPLFSGVVVKLLLVAFITTLITMGLTGLTAQVCLGKKESGGQEEHGE